jgi:hypothetical protein
VTHDPHHSERKNEMTHNIQNLAGPEIAVVQGIKRGKVGYYAIATVGGCSYETGQARRTIDEALNDGRELAKQKASKNAAD